MQTTTRTLIVSIHDVSPLTQTRVTEMLHELAACGIGQTSLLVVPDHHGKAPLEDSAGFGQWLQEAHHSGHETVVHGFYHRRPSSGNWATRLVTERYTAGEGEFFDLSEEEAARRLARAREIFSRLGLKPRGFIAPAWLLGKEAQEAVRKAGFEYTTRLGEFLDLQTGAVTRSQSLVWSVRAGWRRAVSRLWNALLFRRLRDIPMLRVGLHPPDWDHPAIRAQCLGLIRAALAGRTVMTYEGWLDHARATR